MFSERYNVVARFSQSYKCSSDNVNKILSNVLSTKKRYSHIIHRMFLTKET